MHICYNVYYIILANFKASPHIRKERLTSLHHKWHHLLREMAASSAGRTKFYGQSKHSIKKSGYFLHVVSESSPKCYLSLTFGILVFERRAMVIFLCSISKSSNNYVMLCCTLHYLLDNFPSAGSEVDSLIHSFNNYLKIMSYRPGIALGTRDKNKATFPPSRGLE